MRLITALRSTAVIKHTEKLRVRHGALRHGAASCVNEPLGKDVHPLGKDVHPVC